MKSHDVLYGGLQIRRATGMVMPAGHGRAGPATSLVQSPATNAVFHQPHCRANHVAAGVATTQTMQQKSVPRWQRAASGPRLVQRQLIAVGQADHMPGRARFFVDARVQCREYGLSVTVCQPAVRNECRNVGIKQGSGQKHVALIQQTDDLRNTLLRRAFVGIQNQVGLDGWFVF